MPEAGEQGKAIEYGWVSDEDGGIFVAGDESTFIPVLMASAADTLPPGTRFEIRRRLPSRYGRSKGVAWYHCAAFDDAPLWGGVDEPAWIGDGGYYLLGQFVTPA